MKIGEIYEKRIYNDRTISCFYNNRNYSFNSSASNYFFTKKSNDEEYQTFLNSVYISCEAYIEDKNISIDNTYTVTLDDLIRSQFLKSTLINPKNNKKVSDDINKNKVITITKDENGVLKYQLEG